jgi:GT2 family glycosyltransferase
MSEGPPRFSIVIPTRGRAIALLRLLKSLEALEYPKDCFEVIVVDDCTSPSMPESERYRLIHAGGNGPANARNLGASAARFEYLALTDDDCVPAPDWLQQFSAAIALYPEAIICGQTRNGLTTNIFAVASQELYDYFLDGHTGSFANTNNLAVARQLFLKTGGFSVTFRYAAAEDRDLCDRWIRAGGKIQWWPQACVKHYHRGGLREFLRQHYSYGFGNHVFYRLRSQREDHGRHFRMESLGFYRGLLGHIIRCARTKGISVALLMAISLLATLVGSLSAFTRQRHS